MQHWSDRKPYWLVLPPVHPQLDPRGRRLAGHAEPRESRVPYLDNDVKSLMPVCRDNGVCRLGEVEFHTRRGEQIHIR